MKAIILITGVQFPLIVIEQAFEYAKEMEAELHTIFMLRDKTEKEMELIGGFQNILEKRARGSHLKMMVDLMDPDNMIEVINICREADQVFLDPHSSEQVGVISKSLLNQGFVTP